MFTFNHTMYAYFFMNAVKILLANVSNFYYLTSVDFLCRINSRTYSLRRWFTIGSWRWFLHDVWCKLSFAHLAVLSFTKYVIYEDDKSVYFANLRLSHCCSSIPHIDSSRCLIVIWSWCTIPCSLSFAFCRLTICPLRLSLLSLHIRILWFYHSK